MLLRRLIGPMVLFEPAPDYCDWETPSEPDISEGLAPVQVLASPNGTGPFNAVAGLIAA